MHATVLTVRVGDHRCRLSSTLRSARAHVRLAMQEYHLADHYYDSEHLAHFADIGKNSPELAAKFFDWYTAVFADGALSAREKSIIALAVAHAVQCPYCIDAYSRGALE